MFIFEWIVGMGSTVMVPIFIIIIGLIFGLGLGKSLKSGLTVAIGFVGLNLVTGLIGQYLGPVSQMLMDKYDLGLSAIDVGWTVASGIAFSTKVGAFIIPICLAVNAIMLVTKLTKTINIDIWNFWHYAFTGAMVYQISGNIWFGFLAAIVHCAVSLRLADWGASLIEEVVGIPGVSIPQAHAASTVPIAVFLDKVYDKIPGLNKIQADPEVINERFGILGEPSTIGFFLGVIMSLMVGLPIKNILTNGIGVATLLYLLPRMVSIIVDGLVPISTAARNFVSKHFADREDLYIGMDSAITLGHPTTLAVSVLMIPFLFLLAAVLPFNIILPASLTGVAFVVCLFTAIHKGNFVRTFISGNIIYTIYFFLASVFAPTITAIASDIGYAATEGVQFIGYLAWNWIGSVFGLFAFLGLPGIIGVLAIGVALFWFTKTKIGGSKPDLQSEEVTE